MRITKAGPARNAVIRSVADAGVFSKAHLDAYSKVEEQFHKENNIGVLMEDIENGTSPLDGALMSVQRAQ